MPATAPKSADVQETRIMLNLLSSLERGGEQSQRRLASDLGVALGLVNAYLKRCIKKGLVKVGSAPARRYAYYLTPHGFAEKSRLTIEYLSYSFSLFRDAKNDYAIVMDGARANGFSRLAAVRDPRSAPRLARLFVGVLVACGRRTVTRWIRAAGLASEFRPCYTTVAAAGRRADHVAARLALGVLRPLLDAMPRLTFALDDTDAAVRPNVQGLACNPTPDPRQPVRLRPRSSCGCSPPIRPGASPCPFRPCSTSAPRTWPASTRGIGRRSAPSWRWPSNWSSGPSGG